MHSLTFLFSFKLTSMYSFQNEDMGRIGSNVQTQTHII